MKNNIFSLFLLSALSLTGCGGGNDDDPHAYDDAIGLAFPNPLQYSHVDAYVHSYRDDASTVFYTNYEGTKKSIGTNSVSSTFYYFDKDSAEMVVPTTVQTHYTLDSNNNWVEKPAAIAIKFNSDRTEIKASNGAFKAKLIDIENMSGIKKPIHHSDIEVTMPTGAKLYTSISEQLRDQYDIYSVKSYWDSATEQRVDYTTLSSVMKKRCGTHSFRWISNNPDLKAYAFECGHENDSSGTLIGIKHDDTLAGVDVGSWKKITLPNSDVAIQLTLDSAYDNFTSKRSRILVKRDDGKIWRGKMFFEGFIGESVLSYSHNVFDAINTKLGELAAANAN